MNHIFNPLIGSSIAFTGNTPPGTKKQTFSVSIDDAYTYVASYPSKNTYMQWYMSPPLEEGNHTITLTEMDGTDVDYALVGVHNQTTVLGKDILVDSGNDNIVWVGHWQTNTSTLTHTNDFHIINHPLGNSTKDSITVGDSFSFQFTGQFGTHLRCRLQLNTMNRDDRICIRDPEKFYKRIRLR